tara:strand:+ start:1145 stop:1627 length:483 start_codon:yes stop_codon:yes gene_type:complete
MGFGYHVSRKARERQVRDAERRIAWFDLLRANEDVLAPVFADDPNAYVVDIMLQSEEAAAVFGIDRETAENLAWRFETFPEWLGDFEPRKGSYERVGALAVEMGKRWSWEPRNFRDSWDIGFMNTMEAPSEWKSARAACLRDRSRARRAIAKSRADRSTE